MCGVRTQVKTRAPIRWACLTKYNNASFIAVEIATGAVRIVEPSSIFLSNICQQDAPLAGIPLCAIPASELGRYAVKGLHSSNA